MSNVNYRRSGALINAGHMYSFFTVCFIVASLVNRNVSLLGVALGCFILTTTATLIALSFDLDSENDPGKFKLFMGFIVMIPYTIVGGLLLIIINTILKLCFGIKGGEGPYE